MQPNGRMHLGSNDQDLTGPLFWSDPISDVHQRGSWGPSPGRSDPEYVLRFGAHACRPVAHIPEMNYWSTVSSKKGPVGRVVW